MPNDNEIIDNIANKEYEFGFVTDIEMDILPAGLNENTIRYISEKKKEPEKPRAVVDVYRGDKHVQELFK